MKYQILFSGKIKKNITNLSSAKLAQRVVKVKWAHYGKMCLKWARLVWWAIQSDLSDAVTGTESLDFAEDIDIYEKRL